MNLSELSIATMTLVRDSEEEQLLRDSLEALARFNLPVYITDGGSPLPFLEFLQGFPNFTLVEGAASGLFAQVKHSLSAAYASGTPYILYTEPDKIFFFEKGLSRFLEQATLDEQSGILLASRSAAGLGSYPAFQQMTETAINNCCTELTGQPLDYTYGPFLLNRRLVNYLGEAREDLGWGWRPYLFGIAHRLGLTLQEFREDFLCPPAQQQDSPRERIYRMRQLEQNIRGIVLAGQEV
ncbi:MAG: hypothetical protein INR73_25790 [Williamsia sp.]|nr:hypothetical protein [Williamsia sp.]